MHALNESFFCFAFRATCSKCLRKKNILNQAYTIHLILLIISSLFYLFLFTDVKDPIDSFKQLFFFFLAFGMYFP